MGESTSANKEYDANFTENIYNDDETKKIYKRKYEQRPTDSSALFSMDRDKKPLLVRL